MEGLEDVRFMLTSLGETVYPLNVMKITKCEHGKCRLPLHLCILQMDCVIRMKGVQFSPPYFLEELRIRITIDYLFATVSFRRTV